MLCAPSTGGAAGGQPAASRAVTSDLEVSDLDPGGHGVSLEGRPAARVPLPVPSVPTTGIVGADSSVSATAEQAGGRLRRLLSVDRLLNLGHRRLVAVYAVSSFAILVALTASALTFGGAAVRDQVDRGLRSSANASASYLGLSLKARADVLVAFAGRPTFVTILASGPLSPPSRTWVADFLASLQHSIDGAYNTWVTTADGTVVDVWPSQPALVGQDFSYRDWFKGAMATDAAYQSSAYVSASPPNPLVVAQSTRVTDPTGKVVGIVGVGFDLQSLQQYVDAYQASVGVRLLVTGRDGTIVAQPGGGITGLVKAIDPDVAAALAGQSGGDDRTADTMAAYAPVPWANGAVVAQLPTAEALAGLGVMQRAVLVTAGVLALLNLGVVLLLYASLRRRTVAEAAVVAANAGLEQRVSDRTAALVVSNRELEAFSYSVSHDLRAPLRSIDAFSQILLNEYAAPLDAEGRRVLGVVLRNVKQMGVLIDDLLAFSRVTRKELDRRPVDMNRLVQATVEEMRAAEPTCDIACDIGDLCTVPGDPALLRQVWTNLLGNAAKFSRAVAQPRVEVRCERVDDECRYTVRDNGVGFDPVYIDKLFKPFSRLHPTAEFEGTGIGLAIVARIVGRHGGRVWAEGTPGGGALFGFALPAERETA